MSGLRALVSRHPVTAFFILAYALAWCAIPFDSFFAPGALIAAVVVAVLRDGLAGLRDMGARLVRWRVGWAWYAVAVAVPLAVHAAAVGANLAAGAPAPGTGQFVAWHGLALGVGMAMVNPTGGPLSEEPSFRGFALPALQAGRSPLAATAVLAALITGWHAPLYFIDSFGLRPIEAVTTVALTFWYAWLFDQASGSALITLLAHATEGSVNTEDLWPAGAAATREVWLYLAAWTLVAAGLLLGHRRFWAGSTGNTEQKEYDDVAVG
ncbi:MAG TPA: CPBP family glutamic-type intramembrane protease [Pilimelia sp.]|nr:CPBP family glutamic-type intramembrane protease [Pilimelia sp.]